MSELGDEMQALDLVYGTYRDRMVWTMARCRWLERLEHGLRDDLMRFVDKGAPAEDALRTIATMRDVLDRVEREVLAVERLRSAR